MNKLNKGLENFIDEVVIERIEEGIRKAEEEWIENYSKMNKVQRFVYNSKINIDIMKSKEMSLKERISLVVLGA